MASSIVLALIGWITAFVSALGYLGIFLLMTVEGILTPIPSELIMPFAGYLAALGQMSIVLAILAGTAGAALGNFVAYQIGYRAGRPLITRHGRILGLGEQEVRWAEEWFAKWGDAGVLIGHAIPGVRSFISYPAGIGRMRLRNFVIFSTLGALIWNSVLVVAGYYLVEQWIAFAEATDNIDLYVALAALGAMIGYIYWRKARVRAARARDDAQNPAFERP